MNLSDIIAVISLIISIIAIFISFKQSNKSNNIALFEKREKFYINLVDIIKRYTIISMFKTFSESKNSPFPIPKKKPIFYLTISHLGENDLKHSFEVIENDIIFLKTNKNLFNKKIKKEITNIISNLKEFNVALSNSIDSKITEDEFQIIIIKLTDTLKEAGDVLLNQINKFIKV